jgi:hypothetical protein
MVDPSGQVIGAGGGVLDAQAESPTVIAAVVARMSAILMYVSFSSSFARFRLANEITEATFLEQ